MKVLKVSINDELDKKLRAQAYQVYGNSKGALSRTIEDALKMFLYLPIKNPNPTMGENIQIYEKMKEKLVEKEFGKFALILNGEFVGVFDSWEGAQKKVLKMHSNAEHGLIWQIGVQRKKRARLGWKLKIVGT